jgi:hypothetical protein
MDKVKNGRSNKKDRFVALPHYIMNTMAWGRLSVTARAAWLEFVRIHNGCNNGKIAMSSRALGERLGVSKTTAERAIKELLTFGFIEITKASTFIRKRRAAEMTPGQVFSRAAFAPRTALRLAMLPATAKPLVIFKSLWTGALA